MTFNPTPDLFAPARSRARDPQTSRDAAERVNVTKDEASIIQALMMFGPMTTAECATKLNRPRENISARFRPMERAGKISETGERRNGSMVWRV